MDTPLSSWFSYVSFYSIFYIYNLIEKYQHNHKLNTITKTENQNIHKRVQNLRIKKKNYTREPRT